MKLWIVGVVLLVVVAGGVEYWVVREQAYNAGYDKAIADAKATQEEIARKAAEEAAKAANPFQARNPLEGVTANPFEDAAKKLNPFSR